MKRYPMVVGFMFHTQKLFLGRRLLSQRVRTGDFAVIAANCWGAEIYHDLQLPYNTPFVGLFLHAPCYLHLVRDFQNLIKTPLQFVSTSSYPSANAYRETTRMYPVGHLGDAEIHFLHYESEAEAREKWNRRCHRLPTNPERLFFMFSQRDGCTSSHIAEFANLKLPHRVCFATQRCPSLPNVFRIPGTGAEVPDGLALYGQCHRFFDLADWLNGGTGHPRPIHSASRLLLVR